MNNNSKANLIAAIAAYNNLTVALAAAGFEAAVDAFFADHTDEEVLAFRHPEMGQLFDEVDLVEIRADLAA